VILKELLSTSEFVVRQQAIPVIWYNPRAGKTAEKASLEDRLREILVLLGRKVRIYKFWDPWWFDVLSTHILFESGDIEWFSVYFSGLASHFIILKKWAE
jgi:hypothetical protein